MLPLPDAKVLTVDYVKHYCSDCEEIQELHDAGAFLLHSSFDGKPVYIFCFKHTTACSQISRFHYLLPGLTKPKKSYDIFSTRSQIGAMASR